MGSIGVIPEPAGAEESGPIIIDIRSDAAGISLKQQVVAGLKPAGGGEKRLPTLLLYDKVGLRLFEEITYLDEYYVTSQEIEVLEAYAARIAERITAGSMVVELGSGNLRKVKILLGALEKSQKHVEYYALDLSRSELERTLVDVPAGTFRYVKCFGLLGTYDDGLEWLRKPEHAKRAKTILSMGSSVGNFTRDEAAQFLSKFAAILSPKDSLLIGLDACQHPSTVYAAYNDEGGITHRFVLNGIEHANVILGHRAFEPSEWCVIGEYDVEAGRHQAFVAPNKDVDVLGVRIHADERIRIEESYKYSPAQSERLWADAGVVEGASWRNKSGNYALHMLNRPGAMLPSQPDKYAARPVPALSEFHELWSIWDTVTRQMIPEDELLSKPINLRNACIFYLGHLPTFFDMKLADATDGKHSEPAYYTSVFERGCDPDVENPDLCHAHSEIPDAWPPLDEILAFQERVRARVTTLYECGQVEYDKWLGRIMHIGFEHEAMHLETLLYMLVQSERTLPPAGTVRPDFEQLAMQARRATVPNEWIDVPAQILKIGIDDLEDAEGAERYFAWDVERPSRVVKVAGFQAKARPITNGEYAEYLASTGEARLPASWVEADQRNGDAGCSASGHVNENFDNATVFLDGKSVRTVYGRVPLKLALDWPAAASYDELLGCANYMGGRIPNLEEARSIYSYVDQTKKEKAANALGKTIPAVNGHLVNNGVEESPPSEPSVNGSSSVAAGPDPNDFHVDLEGANVGFKHWHPMPVTRNGGRLAGQGDMGGAWEWTSTVLEEHPGYEAMSIYPNYSSDFFDEKHNIVLGGSWATHPRLAGRRSFVNWYQRNYPYVWAGARLVRDI